MGRTFGTDILERSATGVTAVHATFDPYQRIPEHGHSELSLCCLLSGDFITAGKYGEQQWAPLSLGIDPHDEMCSVRVGPSGMRLLFVFFNSAELPSLAQDAFTNPVYSQEALTGRAVLRLLTQLDEPGDDFAVSAFELLSEFDERHVRETSPPRWLLCARDIVHARFREPIHLGNVAKEIGVDPTYLARAFRRFFGATPSEYIRTLRVVEASRLIMSENASIGGAANEAGFFDHAHFTKAYR